MTDGFTLSGQAPGTYGPFFLEGGMYALSTIWGASATIVLNRVGPDGATQVSVQPLTSGSPYVVMMLSPGFYQVVIGVAASSIGVQKIAGAGSRLMVNRGGKKINMPVGLPNHFALGVNSKPTTPGITDLAWMQSSGVPWDYRMSYFTAGQAQTPGSYVSESVMAGYIPVIEWYNAGTFNGGGGNPLLNINNTAIMAAYYASTVTTLKGMAGWAGWNLQKSGSTNATISDDRTTATFTGGTAADDPTISGNFHKTGKWTVRFHVVAVGGTSFGPGFGDPSTINGAYLGQTGFNSLAMYGGATGFFFTDTTHGALTFTYAPGDNIDMAIDLDNKLLWIRQNNGNWNGNATFVPGDANGLSFSTLSVSAGFAPAVNLHYPSDQITFGTPPVIAGFPAWNSTPVNPPMIVDIEQDLWGFLQQRGGPAGAQEDDPTQVTVSVASSGYAGPAGFSSLPNTAVGFAQAFKLLRDTYAPNVYMSWHCSSFGPNDGFIPTNSTFTNTPLSTGQRIGNFYNGLNTKFDLAMHDCTTGDGDSDYGILVGLHGQPQTAAFWWWTAGAFEAYRQLLLGFHGQLAIHTPGFLFNVAIGNTLYKSLNDTAHHYQDNKVEFFLTAGTPQGTIYDANAIRNFLQATIVGIIFGAAQPNTTDNYDYAADGITNPASITNQNGWSGNTNTATVSDDDGGFLRAAATLYYASAVPLP